MNTEFVRRLFSIVLHILIIVHECLLDKEISILDIVMFDNMEKGMTE